MGYIKKNDRPVVAAAASEALAVVRPQAKELGELITATLYGLDVEDRLFDEVKRIVMNDIGMALFAGMTPPVAPGLEP